MASPEEIARREAAIAANQLRGRRDDAFRAAQVPARFRLVRLNGFYDVVPDDDYIVRVPPEGGTSAEVTKNRRVEYARVASSLRMLLAAPVLVALIGEIGAGKSALGCGLINEFCDRGWSARYTKTADCLEQIVDRYKNVDHAKMQAFVRPALLVLDELQARRVREEEDLALFRLLDKRYDDHKSTLLISNHATEEDLAARLDARSASRMREGGGVLVCDWPDVRGQIAVQSRANYAVTS